MTAATTLDNRPWGRKFIAWQIFAIFLFASCVGILLGLAAARAFIEGGVACILPNMFLVNRLFAHRGARQAKKIVTAFYVGEAGKLILTAMLTGLVLHRSPDHVGFFFAGLILAQSAVIWAPMAIDKLRLN